MNADTFKLRVSKGPLDFLMLTVGHVGKAQHYVCASFCLSLGLLKCQLELNYFTNFQHFILIQKFKHLKSLSILTVPVLRHLRAWMHLREGLSVISVCSLVSYTAFTESERE